MAKSELVGLLGQRRQFMIAGTSGAFILRQKDKCSVMYSSDNRRVELKVDQPLAVPPDFDGVMEIRFDETGTGHTTQHCDIRICAEDSSAVRGCSVGVLRKSRYRANARSLLADRHDDQFGSVLVFALTAVDQAEPATENRRRGLGEFSHCRGKNTRTSKADCYAGVR